MLNVKEQRAYQGTKPQYSPERDASVVELAVLGACRCPGVGEACPCSRTAAASRKQLAQLQQEIMNQNIRRPGLDSGFTWFEMNWTKGESKVNKHNKKIP
uniref:Uncharacterized protein n=1 Tax=Lates calcarifer TaxID=8187 RepID=A0A4W6E5L2_LATCA